MPPSKGAGRPSRASRALSRDDILAVALPLAQREGAEAISFRRLAALLEASPMAVKYHVGDQHGLLAALVERAFAGLLEDLPDTTPGARLREVLTRYCARAIENAPLVRHVLGDISLMGAPLTALTEEIRRNTRLLNDGDPGDVMLSLLVDHAHGFVFSVAAAGGDRAPTLADYQRALDWVLSSRVGEKTME